MQGYATNPQQAMIRNYMLGKDSRSNQGIYARGNAYQSGLNQYVDAEAIRRRLERMQGIARTSPS